jgi:hypothetical protein
LKFTIGLIKCDYVEVQLQVFFKCRHSLPVTGQLPVIFQLPDRTHFPQDKRHQYPLGRYSAVIGELLRRTPCFKRKRRDHPGGRSLRRPQTTKAGKMSLPVRGIKLIRSVISIIIDLSRLLQLA